jgi:hypothetical protein
MVNETGDDNIPLKMLPFSINQNQTAGRVLSNFQL